MKECQSSLKHLLANEDISNYFLYLLLNQLLINFICTVLVPITVNFFQHNITENTKSNAFQKARYITVSLVTLM